MSGNSELLAMRLIYFTYSKPMPGSPKTGTATLAHARFDGSP
jgi:hypothetical protein